MTVKKDNCVVTEIALLGKEMSNIKQKGMKHLLIIVLY